MNMEEELPTIGEHKCIVMRYSTGAERERPKGLSRLSHSICCVRMAATQDAKDAMCNVQRERSMAQHAAMLATIRANLQNHAIQSRIRNGAGAPIPRAATLLPRGPFRHPKMYLCTIPRGKVFSKRDIFGDYATEYDNPFSDKPDEPWNIELSEPASSRPSDATISNSNKNRFSNMCEE